MKKIIALVLLTLSVLSSLFLPACNSNLSQAEKLEAIHNDALKTAIRYNEALDLLKGAQEYEYSVSIYKETLANFDYIIKEMPNYKDNPEEKKWYKPIIKYSYTKIDAGEYVKISLIDVQKDEYDMPKFEDGKNNNPLYNMETIAEYNLIGGDLEVKVDGISVFSGALIAYDPENYDNAILHLFPVQNNPNIILNIMEEYSDVSSFIDSIFFTENKAIFAKRITLYKTINIISTTGALIPFSLSDNATGLAEDFSVDWSLVNGIVIDNICVTARNDRVLQVEFNSEKIYSYQRTVSQIWNNERVLNWYGDRVEALKMVVELNYGTRKNPVNIP